MPQELTNLLIPFRRDKKRDFASGTGPDILRSKVLQTLLTQGATPRSSGELPWRTAFGAGLEILRHQRSDAALAELARVQIRDALRRWVPEAAVVGVRVERSDATLELRVRVRDSARSSAAGDTEELALTISA
ncbi:MAG: GPW/gp25 family protein [Candidatus Eisenbacteria bacterium]